MNLRLTIFEILVEIGNFFLGFKDGFVVKFEPFDQDAFTVVDKIARIQKTLVEVEFFGRDIGDGLNHAFADPGGVEDLDDLVENLD